MKKVILTAMVLGLILAQEVNATVLYYYGVVDSVSTTNPLIKVGDAVYVKINYLSGAVNRLTVVVNDSPLNLIRQTDGSTVYVDENPADGTVQWQTSSTSFSANAATNTPGGVIPCIDNFDLGHSFQIFFNGIIANGSITATPRTKTGQ